MTFYKSAKVSWQHLIVALIIHFRKIFFKCLCLDLSLLKMLLNKFPRTSQKLDKGGEIFGFHHHSPYPAICLRRWFVVHPYRQTPLTWGRIMSVVTSELFPPDDREDYFRFGSYECEPCRKFPNLLPRVRGSIGFPKRLPLPALHSQERMCCPSPERCSFLLPPCSSSKVRVEREFRWPRLRTAVARSVYHN